VTDLGVPQRRPDGPAPLSWDELDELADWTVGELTAAAAARVADLVRTDARWAAAYAGLVAAEPAVRASLRVTATAIEPMPQDLVQRLTATIGGLSSTGAATTAHRGQGRPSTAPHAPSGPGSRRPPARRPPGRPGRTSRRQAVLTGATAVLLVLAGLGGVTLAREQLGSRSAPGFSADSPDQAEGGPPAPSILPTSAPLQGPPTGGSWDGFSGLVASGTDYEFATLARFADEPRTGSPVTFTELRQLNGAGDGLDRLATVEGFGRCLNAVRAAHPGTVVAADFARYEGNPAVILLIEQGTSTVVAVGPDCGIAGADELAAVEVG
jgi:hypothetical protein